MLSKKHFNEVCEELQTNLNEGLSTEEAKTRFEKHGPNALKEAKKQPLIVKFLKQFLDFMVIILMIAAVVTIVLAIHEGKPEDIIEGIIIFVVVLINAILGTWQENKAEKSLEALKSLSTPNAKVYRDGVLVTVKSSELVPGDIISIEAGDFVPADARIFEAVSLQVDESALTGESVPVNKSTEEIDKEELALGDMHNCLFSSTYVTYGKGKAIVTGTGMNTEIGKIASSLMSTEKEVTPLQMKLNQISKVISIVCLVICVIVFGINFLADRSQVMNAFLTAVALAVASIPEGLATVVTVVLSIGVEKMVKRQAIVKKLPAVETLGCASVICSDKTGTLTQNKMTVVKFYQSELKDITDQLNEEDKKMIEFFSICSDASSTIVDGVRKDIGDPTEVALVVACQNYVENPTYTKYQRVYDLPFDSDRKMMSVILDYEGKYLVITKGAPDIILSKCSNKDEVYENAMNANNEMASNALRILGVGYKVIDEVTELTSEIIENDLTFLGLVGMIDPARPEVKEAIKLATSAGIKTVMITGDHVATATAIAKELNILQEGDIALSNADLKNLSDEELEQNIEKYSVYARVAPEDKVRIVKAWQSKGHVVAMTGDGVNDSPALKKADIGCAMGITGTDVAKEAAEVVLVDDNFQTIVSAVHQGRGIYANIKKVVKYLLSSNIGEVLTIFVASLIGLCFKELRFGIPLLSMHLLWVNLITDSLPAFALGCEEAEDDVMKEKPRPKKESFFAHGMAASIILEGIMIGAITLAAYAIGHYFDKQAGHLVETYNGALIGQTMAFVTLSSAQLFHAFNVKTDHTLFTKKLFNNKFLWGAFALGLVLQIAIIYIPGVNNIFQVLPLNLSQLAICIGLAMSTILIMEIAKLIKLLVKIAKKR